MLCATALGQELHGAREGVADPDARSRVPEAFAAGIDQPVMRAEVVVVVTPQVEAAGLG